MVIGTKVSGPEQLYMRGFSFAELERLMGQRKLPRSQLAANVNLCTLLTTPSQLLS